MTETGGALTNQLRSELGSASAYTGAAAIGWLSTVLRFAGQWTHIAGRPALTVVTAEHTLSQRVANETHRLTGARPLVADTGRRDGPRFTVRIERPLVLARLTEIVDRRGRPCEGLAPMVVTGSSTVQLAAMRAALGTAGIVSSPRRGAMTIECPTMAVAVATRGLLRRIEVAARIRSATVDGPHRVDISGDGVDVVLRAVGATATARRWGSERDATASHLAAQRVANFDTANANRAATSAAVTAARVTRAFDILEDTVPDHLAAIGRLRQQHPDKSLEELGRLADPPTSKDTAAGRLRRLLILGDNAARAAGIPDTYDALPTEIHTAADTCPTPRGTCGKQSRTGIKPE